MDDYLTNTFSYEIGDKTVKVTVRRASVRLSVRRFNLSTEGEKKNKENPDPELDFIRLVTYPTLAVATVAVTGFPFPFTPEDIADADEDFITHWFDEIIKTNPLWKVTPPEQSDPKKEPASATG